MAVGRCLTACRSPYFMIRDRAILARPSCDLAKRRDFLLIAAACGGGYVHVPRRSHLAALADSLALDYRRDTHAAGRADRDQSAAAASLGQLLGQRGQDACARGSERM